MYDGYGSVLSCTSAAGYITLISHSLIRAVPRESRTPSLCAVPRTPRTRHTHAWACAARPRPTAYATRTLRHTVHHIAHEKSRSFERELWRQSLRLSGHARAARGATAAASQVQWGLNRGCRLWEVDRGANIPGEVDLH